MKIALKKIEKGIRFIENVMLFICGAIFMLLMLLSTGDVLGRFLFDKPITGTYEMSEIMMGAVVLLGWAYTQRVGEHVSVDLFYNRFPAGMQTITSLIVQLLCLALFIAILIQSWSIAMEATIEGRHFLTINWPTGPFYFLVPIGAFFICLEFIIRIFHLSADLRNG